jgi:hypothetical protein
LNKFDFIRSICYLQQYFYYFSNLFELSNRAGFNRKTGGFMKIIAYTLLFFLIITSCVFAADIGNWRNFSIFDVGIGLGSRHYPVGDNKPSGFVAAVNVFPIALGFGAIGSFGIGSKIYESAGGMKGHGHPASFLPIYVYYPLFSSTPKDFGNGMRNIRRRFCYLFLGGSQWGTGSNYLHTGIAMNVNSFYLGYDQSADERIGEDNWLRKIPFSNYGFQMGIYKPSDMKDGTRKIKGDIGYYLAASFRWGGASD